MSRTGQIRLSFLPIPGLIILVAIIQLAVDPSVFFEPKWLLPITNTLFVTAVCFVVAWIALRNYEATGRIQVLLLGCGLLPFGIGGVLAAFLRNLPGAGANLNVTVYNIGALLGGTFHFVAASILLSGVSSEMGSKRKDVWLIAGYTGVSVFMGLVTLASIKGVIPLFFVQSTGPTPLRQAVLWTADALFAFSFVVFMATYLRKKEVFLYWYSCALALTTISLTAFYIESSVGGPVGWAGRFSQYLGGVYFLIAVITAARSAKARRTSLDEVLTTSLSPAEEKFRVLAENSPDIIVRFDREMRHIYVNSAGLRLYRQSAGSVIGSSIDQAGLSEPYGNFWKDPVQRVFRSGEPAQVEGYLPVADGTAFFQSRCVPEYGPDGSVANVLVVSRDLTERKRAEEEYNAELEKRVAERSADLAKERQRFYDVLEALPAMICLLTPDYLVAFANRGFREHFGDSNGRRCYDYCFGRSEPCEFCEAFEVLKTGQPHHWELTSPDGGRIIDAWDFPFTDVDGTPLILEMDLDITQRKRAEAELDKHRHQLETLVRQRTGQLEAAKASLEQAAAAKDQFIAKLSHELRTPLTPVVASLSALMRDARIPDDLREDMAMLERNIGLEVNLINDLLDVTRIVSGKLMLSRGAVDLAEVLRGVGQIVATDLDAKGQTLTIDTAGAPHWVDGDRARLHQVFWNLVKNAIKFSPEHARIEVEGAAANGVARVVVRDTGQGIDASELPRLFRAFEQGGAGQSFGGLGLGLAICKGIVDLHGGSIWAASEGKGRGARFTVELPLLAIPPASTSPAPAAQGGTAKVPLRILLVEDHEDSARVMVRLLRAEDHEVTWAATLKEALAAAESGDFDVLVSDLGLPDGSGYDLMRGLLASGKKLRGIAVSGYGTADDVQRALDAGFSEHVTKPVSFAALHDALVRVANGGTKDSLCLER